MSAWLVASNISVHHVHFLWRLKQFTILPERNLLICRAVCVCRVERGEGCSGSAATDGRDKGTEKRQAKWIVYAQQISKLISGFHRASLQSITFIFILFFLLALQPSSGVVFYSPLAGFSLLACEVSWSHTTTRHSR